MRPEPLRARLIQAITATTITTIPTTTRNQPTLFTKPAVPGHGTTPLHAAVSVLQVYMTAHAPSTMATTPTTAPRQPAKVLRLMQPTSSACRWQAP